MVLGKTFFIYSLEISMRDSISLSLHPTCLFILCSIYHNCKKLDISLFSSGENKIYGQTNDRENNREVESYEANFL